MDHKGPPPNNVLHFPEYIRPLHLQFQEDLDYYHRAKVYTALSKSKDGLLTTKTEYDFNTYNITSFSWYEGDFLEPK